ncbi:MAG: zinc ribbon domain-containing protein [Proteobacteria bacterium]|nr:zinc ribbon domain-containing protein [Pseudomonadota bacterium]MDA1187445.1 zinc ribbon domain-containing protein [Pseudomonadota bacterium]
MPIYAYACSACGFRQDILQRLSDAPVSECPSCHEASFAKQLTAPSFVLKGSGWYATDFRDNGSKKKADDPAVKGAEPAANADAAAGTQQPKEPQSNSAAGAQDSAGGSKAADAPAPSSPVGSGSSSPVGDAAKAAPAGSAASAASAAS